MNANFSVIAVNAISNFFVFLPLTVVKAKFLLSQMFVRPSVRMYVRYNSKLAEHPSLLGAFVAFSRLEMYSGTEKQ